MKNHKEVNDLATTHVLFEEAFCTVALLEYDTIIEYRVFGKLSEFVQTLLKSKLMFSVSVRCFGMF